MRFAGYRWYANLVVPFADSPPTLVLFGRGESAFTAAEVTEVYDHRTYDATVRQTLRSDLRLSVTAQNGIAQLEAQLLEPGGAVCTRTGCDRVLGKHRRIFLKRSDPEHRRQSNCGA